MAMTNMPVEYFGYYTFVEPFVDGYYKAGETEKGRELFNKLKLIYQDRLDYYAGIPLDEQYDKIEEIISDMEGYRRNIDILIQNDDRELAEKETAVFNDYIDRFSHFYRDDLLDDVPPPEEVIDTLPAVEDSAIREEVQVIEE